MLLVLIRRASTTRATRNIKEIPAFILKFRHVDQSKQCIPWSDAMQTERCKQPYVDTPMWNLYGLVKSIDSLHFEPKILIFFSNLATKTYVVSTH